MGDELIGGCSWNKKINLIWIALWEWAIQLNYLLISLLPQAAYEEWNSSIKRGGKWENWAAFLLFWLWVMSAERHRQQAKREDQPQLISSAEPEGNKPITKRKQRESTALFGLSFGWLWPLALLQPTNTPQLIHYSLINCCCGARPLREKKTSPRSSTTTKERAPNPHSFVGLWVKS